MSLTQLQTLLSGDQMLTQLKHTKINSRVLDTSVISTGISTLVDESINIQATAQSAINAISSISIGMNIDNQPAENTINVGRNLSAETAKSIVIGNNVKTELKDNKGWESIAIGNYIQAAGKNSIAIGNGDSSFSENGHPNGDFGNRGAGGDYSIALGNAGANGRSAIAIGQQNHSDSHGISIGRMHQDNANKLEFKSDDTVRRTGKGAITIGTYSVASADNSIVIGNGRATTTSGQVLIGAPNNITIAGSNTEPAGTCNMPSDANRMTWIGQTSNADQIWFGNKNLANIVSANVGNVIKKDGDTNIGPLHISGELSVDGTVKLVKGVYIGNKSETLYAPSANMMFSLGENLSVLGTNSMAVGSKCIAGTNVLSVIDMYFSDNHDNNMAPNTIKLDSVEGLAINMTYLLKITANYGTTGQILSINTATNIISCDQIPSITYSKFHSSSADGKTDIIGANKTTNLNVLWIKDHPEIGTIAYADGAHAEGIDTKATQDCCHAEGRSTVALGKYSHAEGNLTYAGYNGHAEGHSTSAMVIIRQQDQSDIQLGYIPDTADDGDQSLHAEGTATKADQYYTHADGIYAWARHRNSYSWNGNKSATSKTNMYQSHGEGTYNINPKNGISGFYISETPLDQILQTNIGLNLDNKLSGCTLNTSNWTTEYIMEKLVEIYHKFGGTVE